ncbi:uncharacterized protein LOC110098517 [Dendrobium catenatum]|uniref:Uncharacterized protein n=1 Tax=Dendrobium catenatum TaxID=906689 RepID=A0A2I0XI50_9ASPA|nr:uncharacterized protein LOC110098517 [Dendrobium catenatum]PKU87596.1 hypothetical protein MA16_Dca016915 [Dendrobium catenatum]
MRHRREGEARRRRQLSGSHKEEEAIKYSETTCSCNSCAAAALADIIAVSCCPCAVLNFLALAFFKLPCAAGRRCMRIVKRSRGALEEVGGAVKREGLENKNVELRVESVMGMEIGDMMEERAWKEMYQVGQWGFGRVSVSGSEA